MSDLNERVEKLFSDQLLTWELARHNYAALSGVRVREIDLEGVGYKIQYNPARMISSGAKVDTKSIQERLCFLCDANLPAPQLRLPFKDHYRVLVNPYPIFPRHLTVPEKEHVPQSIASRFADLLDLAACLTDYTVFYNGPRCGASAPDHAHFQAGNRGFLPIERQWRADAGNPVARLRQASLWLLDRSPRTAFVLESSSARDAEQLFDLVFNALPIPAGDVEPMMNVLTWFENERWTVIVFPRAKHRPQCYFAEGNSRLLSSPASVDLGGVFILPVEHDFNRFSADSLSQILSEVCLSTEECRKAGLRIVEQLNNYHHERT